MVPNSARNRTTNRFKIEWGLFFRTQAAESGQIWDRFRAIYYMKYYNDSSNALNELAAMTRASRFLPCD